MTPTERLQKIEAAKKITERFLPFHRIHLEEGYVEATEKEAIDICVNGNTITSTVSSGAIGISFVDKKIWAIDSKSRLVQI